jgi:hypothetical protein
MRPVLLFAGGFLSDCSYSMSERIPKMFWRAQRQGGFSLLFGSLEYFGLRPFAFDYKGA